MKKVFRPDGVRTKILGLILVLFIVPLLFLVMDIYAVQVDKISPPTSDPFVFRLALGIEFILLLPVLYGILSLLRSNVILDNDRFIVNNGFKKKTIQIKQIKEITYQVRSKGEMSYKTGVVTYQKNSSDHELELPVGWYYLQDLIKELKNLLGVRLVIDEECFQTWQKWYQTPLLKKISQVLLAIALLVLFVAPPTLAWFWFSTEFNLFGFNAPREERSGSQTLLLGLFYGLVVCVWFYAGIFLLKVIDFRRKILRK